MNLTIKIYTKPMLSNISNNLVQWPRIAKIDTVIPKSAKSDQRLTQTIIEKTTAIPAPISKVWGVVGDPMNMPAYCRGMVSIEKSGEDTYTVIDAIPPENGDLWSTAAFEEKLVSSKEEDHIVTRTNLGDGKFVAHLINLLEEDGKTIMSYKFDANFRVLNHSEVEADLDNIIMDIAELSTMKNDAIGRLKEYQQHERI
jgi:carbon monoxide dehydrogenase subunit G